MQIKILKTMSGADGVKRRGDIHTFDDAEAKNLIAAGIATDDLNASVKIFMRGGGQVPFTPNHGQQLANTEQPPVDIDSDAISAMKRDELNELAAQVGIEDADQLPNKDAVVAAILAKALTSATNGEPPELEEEEDGSGKGEELEHPPVDVAEISALKRPELDELAAEVGIENADQLPNKGAVIDAIVEKVGAREGDA